MVFGNNKGLVTDPGSVLIDDYSNNCADFMTAGTPGAPLQSYNS